MRILVLSTFFCLFSLTSVFTQTASKKRLALVAGTNVGVLSAGLIGAHSIWYAQFPKSKFHTFDDRNEWQNMDKYGHVFTAYQLTNVHYQTWKWTGLNERKSLLIGSSLAWVYQFSLEILDAYNQQWGFSWSDVAANTAGVAFFTSQELLLKRQAIQLKFGYKSTRFAQYRPNVLGSNFQEQLLKDYNGQSYWLAVAPTSFLSDENKVAPWLQLAFGTSIDGQLYGDKKEVIIQNKVFTPRKEFAMGLDIDWSQLPMKRKKLKKILTYLNLVKMPLPAVYWRNGVCYFGMF